VLRWAVARLRQLFGPLRVAPLYRTVAVSPFAQPYFYNTVTVAHLPPDEPPDPYQVLMRIKALERRTGRLSGERDRPRTLDVDLLLYGDLVRAATGCSEAPDPAGRNGGVELILPHPRMRQRKFVLAPLADLAPDLRLPPDGARVGDLLAALGSQDVEKIGWSVPPEVGG
jgi:2-amino-4-hydroxy-6-hydroxymethyldihydropteridine diphosphokinase